MKYLKRINDPTHFYTWCKGEGHENDTRQKQVLRNDVDSDEANLYFVLVGYVHCTLDLSNALIIEAVMLKADGCTPLEQQTVLYAYISQFFSSVFLIRMKKFKY